MGVTLTTSISEINEEIQREIKRTESLVIRALSYLGEQCVSKVRDRSFEESWIDQSGNLRSSIGYVIVHSGEIVTMSSFQQVKEGSDGCKIGKQIAEDLADKISNDYALIVVAGMNYAELVEAIDSKDVLASAELFAKNNIGSMMEKLKNQIHR